MDVKRFLSLHSRLLKLLDEQIELSIILNPYITNDPELCYKHVGREFDISQVWTKKIRENVYKRDNGGDWSEELFKDNEVKRQLFFSLSQRLDEFKSIINLVIREMLPDEIDEEMFNQIFI